MDSNEYSYLISEVVAPLVSRSLFGTVNSVSQMWSQRTPGEEVLEAIRRIRGQLMSGDGLRSNKVKLPIPHVELELLAVVYLDRVTPRVHLGTVTLTCHMIMSLVDDVTSSKSPSWLAPYQRFVDTFASSRIVPTPPRWRSTRIAKIPMQIPKYTPGTIWVSLCVCHGQVTWPFGRQRSFDLNGPLARKTVSISNRA